MDTIRQCLDQSLVKLAALSGPQSAIRRAEEELGQTLAHVYRAQASRAELAAFQAECSAAVEGSRRTLELLREQAQHDDAAAEAIALVAQALNELLSIGRLPMDDARKLPRRGEA